MTEEFIQYLWRYQLLGRDCVTTSGEEVVVVSPGTKNLDSGPDYLNARIRIGDTLWAGDVEIHVRSSDWVRHGHGGDRAYDGVILHLVYADDQPVVRWDGQVLPALVVDGLFDRELYLRYEIFITGLGSIPCENQVFGVPRSVWQPWCVHLVSERLVRKSQWVERLFSRNKGNPGSTFYQCLAGGFGLKANVAPFEWLAGSLDRRLLLRYHDDLELLESLLFGQAGFLGQEPVDDYAAVLQERYNYLRHKHELQPIPVYTWKFLRMRPPGFPTLKIAMWAAFLHQHVQDLPLDRTGRTAAEWFGLLAAETSPYWRTHYHFGKKLASPLTGKPGKDTQLSILLNSIIPFQYVHGTRTGDSGVFPDLVNLMQTLPAEENSVIRNWRSLGVGCSTALESQALLELKDQYCDRKGCLGCALGNYLVRNGNHGPV